MGNITLLIILVTAGFSIYAWSAPTVLEKYIFNPYKIETDKQYYRLITSGFIHQDWPHLFFNMFTLFFFGNNVEYYYKEIYGPLYGALLYLLLYLIGIGLSDGYAFVSHRNSKSFNSLGASGGVASIIYASILFSPLDKVYIYFIGIPGFIYAVLYLIYCSYSPRHLGQNINHNAHFWGSIIGIVYTIIIYPAVVFSFFHQLSQW